MRGEKGTYVNQKWLHLLGVILEPAVGVESVAVVSKQGGIPVVNPGIYT